MTRRVIAVVAATLAVAACTATGSTPSAASPSAATTGSSGPLVSGRASTPADISAPGIQVPAGGAHFSVQVGSHEIVITGNDWDTIVATSRVASDVGVEFASGFNWTATTRNRFQYLADLIAQDESSRDFDPINVITGFKNGTATSDVALYNPGSRAGILTGLKVTIISRPGKTLIGYGDFFETADSSLFIPAKTIVFARLGYPIITQPKPVNGSWETSTNFYFERFAIA